MTAQPPEKRRAYIASVEREAERWNGYVDTLLRAFNTSDVPPPALGSRMTSLRHKRDRVLTKVEALKRHHDAGWAPARREYELARRELRDAWRLALAVLQKESLFV